MSQNIFKKFVYLNWRKVALFLRLYRNQMKMDRLSKSFDGGLDNLIDERESGEA